MRVETGSKVEIVYQALAERLSAGIWKVGEYISTEEALAREFGYGRNTISKAIARMAHEGLVERKKRAGTRVLQSEVRRERTSVDLNAVAFICPSEQHEGIWRTIRGFQQAAGEKKRRTLTLTTGSDYRKELEIIGRLVEFDVQGVAMNGVEPLPENVTHFQKRLQEASLPMIQAGAACLGLQIPSVIVDGFHASHTMIHYLFDKGVRRIGYFDTRAPISPWILPRYQGYRWTLAELGLVEDPRLVCARESKCNDFNDPLAESKAFAREYLDQIKGLNVEAVVCGTDYWALGLIAAAMERGIEVPRDLMVTGVDDYAMASSAPVPLTTYRVPFEAMGRKSYEMLEEMISTGRWRKVETQVQMRGEVVIRNSA